MAEPIDMQFGLRTLIGQRKHVLDGDPDPHAKGQVLGKGHAQSRELCKKWLNQLRYCLDYGLRWLKKACIRWGSRSPMRRGNFRGIDMLGHAKRHSAVSPAKTAEPIEMLFGLWTRPKEACISHAKWQF